MSPAECGALGVAPECRKFYFRLGDGKENMSRPADITSWFKLESVLLGNSTSDRPEDEVGVVTLSDIAAKQSSITNDRISAIQGMIAAGEYRESVKAKDWAGGAVAEILGLDIENPSDVARVKVLLKKMLADGWLSRASVKDKKGTIRPIIKAGNTISFDEGCES